MKIIMNSETIALIIFIISYIGIIFTRLPGLNIDRPSAAFFGAVSMVAFGVLTFDEAIQAIDFNTIILLLGMMIMVAVLEIDGFFALIAERTITFSKTRNQFLLIVIFVTGISSAFLVNDAVVLIFTSIIIVICRKANLNPIPFLIAEILASNAGSALTITGNPQNILIGMQMKMSYGYFLLLMAPVSFLSMTVIYFVIKFAYKDVFNGKINLEFGENKKDYNYLSMKFSVPIFFLTVAGFFVSKIIGFSYPLIALIGASLILLLGKVKPSKVVKEVDWVLLLFFAGLFIVVSGAEKSPFFGNIINSNPVTETFNGIAFLHGLSLILSQIISNVPFTILMLPILNSTNSDLLWLTLASSATLAGNFTIIGAMANLIAIEIAKSLNIEIKFWEFFKVGAVVTIVTLIISISIMYVYLILGL